MARTVLVLTLFTAACSVGEVSVPGGDGGNNGGGDGAVALACVDRGTPGTAHNHTAGGTPNAGQACIVAGCHLDGQLGAGAPPYTYAGTAYQLDGVTANPGAILRIVPPSGIPITVTADTAGNFSVGTVTNPFPAHTDVSACPSMQKMVGALNVANDGNCSGGAGCHGIGGAAGTIKLQ